MLDQSVSFNRSNTPPPPTSPVKTKKKKDVKLIPEEIPPVVDHFNVGDELEDDWFGEDTNTITTNLASYKPNDSDDEGPRNPMVAGDEDVEPIVEYYSKENNVLQIHPKEEEEEELEKAPEEAEEESERIESYRPPVFKSELDDVWSRSLRRLSGPEIVSDSDDEDNRQTIHNIESPYLESPSFNFGAGGSSGEGYEEIGGSNENPWSTGQTHHNWETNEEPKEVEEEVDNNQKQKEVSPKQEEPPVVVSPKKKKTKKSSKKKSSK